MGLLFFNLMVITLTLTALVLLIFGIEFIVNSHVSKKGKTHKREKRSYGITLTIFGSILTPIFLVVLGYVLYRESNEGADFIGGSTIPFLLLILWWAIIPIFLAIGVIYFVNGSGFLKRGKSPETGEIVDVDYYVLGGLFVLFGILYFLSGIGTAVFPASLALL